MNGEGDVGEQGSKIRKVISVIILSITGLVFAMLILPAVFPGIRSALSNRSIEESLEDRLVVSELGTTSLQFGDGRVWEIPGAPLSEVGQEALREAVARGVEIDEYNNAYGLLQIHHWCGNDPIRDHLARIELSQLLEHVESQGEFWFTEWGWNISQYHRCVGTFDDLDVEAPGDDFEPRGLEQGE